MKSYAEGGQVQPEEGILDAIRNYVMAHNGLGGTDNKDYQTAMNVDASSDSIKSYAQGGMIEPDMGDVPIPGQPVPPTAVQPAPQSAPSPLQGILSNAQATGSQINGPYTPDNRNALYAALLQKQNSMPNAVGSGLASVGDAIARGYGHSQSDFLDKTMQGAKESVNQALGAFDTAQKGTREQTQAGLEMGRIDPSSSLSKMTQDAYSGPLQKLGYAAEQIAKMPASQIESVAQVALKYGDIQAQKELKEATLKLQTMTALAGIDNQRRERELAEKRLTAETENQRKEREEKDKAFAMEANKETSKHWLTHPIDALRANKAIAAQGQPQAPSFNSEEEAKKANLPSGSIVTIGGRRARID